MNFNVTIEIVTSKEVKICGALGPCVSLHRKTAQLAIRKLVRVEQITGKLVH
jgi:protein transport protein SEC23